jgi:uncharacterized protein
VIQLLRDLAEDDLDSVYALNQSEVPKVGNETPESFRHIVREAIYNKVAVQNGEIAGFLIALGTGANYSSVNYQWFLKRYSDFVYIDRIAISPQARRTGLGKAFYEDVFRFAKERNSPIVTCEVNIRPKNEVSIRFHEAIGFKEVGTQDTKGGTITVSLLEKKLF